MVHDFMARNGGDLEAAVKRVCQTLLSKPKETLETFLIWAVKEAERDALHLGSRPAFQGNGNGGRIRPDTQNHRAPTPVSRDTNGEDRGRTRFDTQNDGAPSSPPRRRAYSSFGTNPMDCLVPVANTGTRKRLGDFTKADVNRVWRYYRVHRETYQTKERAWKRVHDRMNEDETLEAAQSRFSEKDQKFLKTEVR